MIGRNCHELRIPDETKSWRIFYHLDSDCVVILGVVVKTTQATPKHVIETCTRRLKFYLSLA